MRQWCWLGLAAGVLLAVAATAAAQGTAGEREELIQIRELEKEIPQIQPFAFDFGGWYRPSYTAFDDPPRYREVVDQDVRLWGSYSIGEEHQFYARLRATYVDWSNGDSAGGTDDSDLVGPNLDQGWYMFRLGRFVQNRFGQKLPVDIDVKLGRQYYEMGYGIVFSRISDMALLRVSNYYFVADLFGAKNIRSLDNLDASAPKAGRDKRSFFGVSARLTNVVPQVEPYIYYMKVDDRNSYSGGPAGQAFGYDPSYLGIGVHGYAIPDLRVYGEFIWEWGDSAALGSLTREDISAHAYVVGGEYYFNRVCTRPRVELEYGVGSGDSDRLSPTSTLFGNLPGTDDDGFTGYGYHDTGVALAPRLANLRVLRVTGAFHPLEHWECLREFEIGASFYWLRKDKAAGGISDFRADVADKDIGTEWDLYANWRITSDLLMSVRYGSFKPGDAFSDDGRREYFLGSLTYSF